MRPALLVLLLLAGAASAAEVRIEGPPERTAWFEVRVPALLSEVESALGFRYGGRAVVRLARSAEEFERLAGSRPEQVVAVAFPFRSVLVVNLERTGPARGTDVASVLRHELVHLLLPARTRNGDRPLWFEEGLAQLLGGRVNRADLARLPVAVAAGTDPALRDLVHRFPDGAARSALAYAKGESVVTMLLEREGIEGLRRLLDRLAGGAAFDAALREEYGMGVAALEEEWRDWMDEEGDPWWLALLLGSFGSLLLFVASLLVVVAFLRARRRKLDTYEALPE